jgi:hypothetical protein
VKRGSVKVGKSVREVLGLANGHKYGARRTEVGGIKFDSAAEAKRYGELLVLKKAGEISPYIEVHPSYELKVNGILICKYVADFLYLDRRIGKWVVEDVKGVPTPAYRLKKKLMKAIHGIEIAEIHS